MNKIILASLIMFGSAVAWQAHAEKINVAEAFNNMQDQLRGAAKERMAAIDTNKDGIVTKEEYNQSEFAQINLQNNLKFSDFDTDKDGKINEKDYFTTLSIRHYQLLVRIAKAEEAKDAKAAEKVEKSETK